MKDRPGRSFLEFSARMSSRNWGFAESLLVKHDQQAKIPLEGFGTLLFLICPCSFFSFTGCSSHYGTEGAKRIERFSTP